MRLYRIGDERHPLWDGSGAAPFAAEVLVDAIAAVRARHPRLQISVRVETSDALVEALQIDPAHRAHARDEVVETEQLEPVKQQYGITPQLASCHTGVVNGYVVEGHVPAADVQKLLKEKPAIRGLTIPGMPQSAPGMDIPGQPYQVLSISEEGATTVWSSYSG